MPKSESMPSWAEECAQRWATRIADEVADGPFADACHSALVGAIGEALAKATETMTEHVQCIGEPFSNCGVARGIAAVKALGARADDCATKPNTQEG